MVDSTDTTQKSFKKLNCPQIWKVLYDLHSINRKPVHVPNSSSPLCNLL